MSTLAEALAPKSDQLNADDLIPGPRVLKITNARISKEDRQTRIIINFEGDNGKPWKPCKTMGRAMVMVWAITDEAQLVGKSVRVYRDPEVRFGDQGQVGGIRISHMSHIEKVTDVKLTVSQGKKSIFKFHPLVTEAKADKAADGVRTLIARIISVDAKNLANVTDDPVVVKQRAWLSSNRPELAAQIDEAIAARSPASEDDPFEGRTDEQHGDQHDDATTDAAARRATDDLLHRVKGATMLSDLANIEAVLAGKRGMLTDEMVTEVESAISDARAVIA